EPWIDARGSMLGIEVDVDGGAVVMRERAPAPMKAVLPLGQAWDAALVVFRTARVSELGDSLWRSVQALADDLLDEALAVQVTVEADEHPARPRGEPECARKRSVAFGRLQQTTGKVGRIEHLQRRSDRRAPWSNVATHRDAACEATNASRTGACRCTHHHRRAPVGGAPSVASIGGDIVMQGS